MTRRRKSRSQGDFREGYRLGLSEIVQRRLADIQVQDYHDTLGKEIAGFIAEVESKGLKDLQWFDGWAVRAKRWKYRILGELELGGADLTMLLETEDRLDRAMMAQIVSLGALAPEMVYGEEDSNVRGN